MLCNGPGDPAALGHIVDQLREMIGRVPIFGICLGHQLLCRAAGLDTYKLRFGHRGANHPVKDLTPGASRSPLKIMASPWSGRAESTRSRPTSRSAGRPTSARPS